MVAGQIGTAVFALAALRIVTAVLSPDTFGLATLFLAALSLAKGLFVAPLLAGQLRYDPRAMARGTVGDLYSAIARLAIVALIAAVVVSLALALLFRLEPPSKRALLLALVFAGWLTADALMSLCFNALNARRQQGRLSFLRIADSLARPAAAIILVVTVFPSALLYVAGRAVGAALLLIGVGAIVWRGATDFGMLLRRSRVQQSAAEWQKRILHYGWPLVPVAMMSWILHLADRFLLNAFHDSAEVGVYAASYALASQPFLMLSGALTLTLRPHLFEAADQVRGDERALFLRRKWLTWLAALGGTGLALIVILRDQITFLLLAPAYRGASGLLVIIGGAHLLLALGQLAENQMFALEETRRVLRVSVWSSVATLLAAVALIPRYAAFGAAWSTFIGLGTYAGLMWLPQGERGP